MHTDGSALATARRSYEKHRDETKAPLGRLLAPPSDRKAYLQR
jgi:hypothetical protein